MPRIRMKSLKEPTSPPKVMDEDKCGARSSSSDVNNCPQPDDTKDGGASPLNQQNVSMKIQGSNKSTVHENTTIGYLVEEQNIHEQHVHNVEPPDGITFFPDKKRISFQVQEGKTSVHVSCTNNEIIYCCYEEHDGQEKSFRSEWIFGSGLPGVIESIMNDCDRFEEFKAILKETYHCKLVKMHNKSCLVLEFLHETEEDRDRMMKDQEKVKTMFMEFLHGIGKDAPSCSLEVSSEPATANIRDTGEIIGDKKGAVDLPSQPLTEGVKKRKVLPKSSVEKSEHKRSTSIEPPLFKKVWSSTCLNAQVMSVRIVNCDRCDDDYSDRTKGHLTSLKSLVCRALRFHPLPASAIQIFTCTTCTQFWRDEKDHLQRYRSVFFIHPRRTSFDVRTKEMSQSAAYQFKKALSAIRNSGGGALIVHSCKNCFTFDSTIDPVLQTMLTDEEIITDGFRWHPKEIGEEILYEIDVSPSDTIATADMKTKLPAWCGNKQSIGASFDKLKLLMLSRRNVSTTEPSVQGLPHKKQTDAVKVYEDAYSHYPSVSAWVNHVMNDLSIPEYVTCMTKRKQGGSVYVGRKSNDNEVDMGGISFPEQVRIHELQNILAEELQKKIHVFNNRYSGIVLAPKDVFQIEIHDTGRNSGVIEIAVRPVDGCVFHDVLGPASFRVEVKSIATHDYDAIVRLSFDEWMKKSLDEVC